MKKPVVAKILIVEDTDKRLLRLREWVKRPPGGLAPGETGQFHLWRAKQGDTADFLQSQVSFTWAESAATAIGIVSRDLSPAAEPPFAGVMFDIDLDKRNVLPSKLKGTDVAKHFIERAPRSLPVFIHSANPELRGPLAAQLRAERFDVEQVGYPELQDDPTPLFAWWLGLLEDLREE